MVTIGWHRISCARRPSGGNCGRVKCQSPSKVNRTHAYNGRKLYRPRVGATIVSDLSKSAGHISKRADINLEPFLTNDTLASS